MTSPETNWEPSSFEVTVPETSLVRGSFVYKGTEKIKNIVKSCGCTKAKLEEDKINFEIQTGFVRYHIPKKVYESKKPEDRFYTFNAFIDVIYKDNTQDRLEIKIKVSEPLPVQTV